MKIIKYEVLSYISSRKLTEEVNLKISLGWVPQGGICSIVQEFVKHPSMDVAKYTEYSQAMVKYEEEKNNEIL